MAEYSFQEVMKRYKDMCKFYEENCGCDYCPIYKAREEGSFCNDFIVEHCNEFEDIVVKWDKLDLKPKYPSWMDLEE